MCIRDSIDIDIANLHLGDSLRLTEISLPEGSEIPGLSDETDQMVVSVNAPKAVEEEPIIDEALEGEEVSEDGGEEKDESGDDAPSESSDDKETEES